MLPFNCNDMNIHYLFYLNEIVMLLFVLKKLKTGSEYKNEQTNIHRYLLVFTVVKY